MLEEGEVKAKVEIKNYTGMAETDRIGDYWVYIFVQVALSMCTIQVHSVVSSSKHGDLSDEETRDIKC